MVRPVRSPGSAAGWFNPHAASPGSAAAPGGAADPSPTAGPGLTPPPRRAPPHTRSPVGNGRDRVLQTEQTFLFTTRAPQTGQCPRQHPHRQGDKGPATIPSRGAQPIPGSSQRQGQGRHLLQALIVGLLVLLVGLDHDNAGRAL